MNQLPLSPEIGSWLENQSKTPEALNPCVRMFGRGPAETICKNCVHLFSHQPSRNRFYKCDLRKCTCGPKTDHRVSWPACARYQERPAVEVKKGSAKKPVVEPMQEARGARVMVAKISI